MQISLALHIIALVMWVGGLLILSRVIAIHVKQQSDAWQNWAPRIACAWIIPGIVISLLTGLHQLFAVGLSFYMKQGWFHAKLTLVIILLVLSVLFLLKVIKKVQAKSPAFFMAVHGSTGLILILVVFLTKLSV